MLQNFQDNDSKNLPIDSLLERLQTYLADVKAKDGSQESLDLMFKFRSFALIAEVYEYVRKYFSQRTQRLSDYFSEMTLKRCLQTVVSIECLQETLENAFAHMKFNDDAEREYLIANGLDKDEDKLLKTVYAQTSILCKNGTDALAKYVLGDAPSVRNSLLWKGSKRQSSDFKFKKTFHRAKEKLDEELDKDNPIYKEDPNYKLAIEAQSLGNHIAHAVDDSQREYLEEFNNDNKGFDFLSFFIEVQHKANSAKAENMYAELGKALEMLRIVFMTDAEDIYYIRTGEFEALKGILDDEVIKKYYTDLPFLGYKEERYDFGREYLSELEDMREDWRIKKGYTGRALTTAEKKDFLKERESEVTNEMKKDDKLWKLRQHSGGLDNAVTADNFARMFYRREKASRDYITLQWKLEIITSELAKLERKKVEEKSAITLTPQEKALSDFVGKIIQLANDLCDKWNGKEIEPAVHQPSVVVTIKNLELIAYLQDIQKSDKDKLLKICYPPKAKSKLDFCNYVNTLKKAYFCNLPNKYIAETLGPIIGLSVGTATNYLSKS